MRCSDRKMLWAAFCLVFHGFLRVSEYTVPTIGAFDPLRLATHKDIRYIRWHKQWLTFTIKYSKMDQLGRSTKIHLRKMGRSTCPHMAMRRYQRQRCGPIAATPLFTFSDGNPLTPSSCRYHLHRLLSQAGYRPDHFNTHSFRIGAATSAAVMGASSRAIKRLGRWRSRTFKAYIRPQPPDRARPTNHSKFKHSCTQSHKL